MKIFVILSVFSVMLVGSPIVQAETACPSIAGREDVVWRKYEGPDFDVCRVFLGKEEIAGVYLGNHPKLEPEQTDDGVKGSVGTYQVKWRIIKENSEKISAETVFLTNVQPIPQFAHIFISAKDESELKSRIKLFEMLAFD